MEALDVVYRDLGLRISALRRAKGWTQESLAERVGLNPSYLARIEAGARRATLESLLRIAQALDVAIGDLFASTAGAPMDFPLELHAAIAGLDDNDVRLLAQVAARFPRAASSKVSRKSKGRRRE